MATVTRPPRGLQARRLSLIAFGIALSIGAVVVLAEGVTPHGLRIALASTARWSFVLFWLAYVGSSLPKLFGPTFAMARFSREWGLAYASAHSVHVLLVFWLYQISPTPPVSNKTALFFVIGLFWTYLLALLSLRRLATRIKPKTFAILRFVGMNYILIAFLRDFVPATSVHDMRHGLTYLPFTVLGLAAPFLRLSRQVQLLTKLRLARASRIG